jgi:hypothetical protein
MVDVQFIFLFNFDMYMYDGFFSLNWLFDDFQLYSAYSIPCVCFSIRFDLVSSYGFQE